MRVFLHWTIYAYTGVDARGRYKYMNVILETLYIILQVPRFYPVAVFRALGSNLKRCLAYRTGLRHALKDKQCPPCNNPLLVYSRFRADGFANNKHYS